MRSRSILTGLGTAVLGLSLAACGQMTGQGDPLYLYDAEAGYRPAVPGAEQHASFPAFSDDTNDVAPAETATAIEGPTFRTDRGNYVPAPVN